MNGVVNIYKPLGITSFGVVKKVRYIVGEKKVGHTGTLDPMAEGVLPVCIGKCTKIADKLTNENKSYRAKIRLGITTDTQDAQGQILSQSAVNIAEKEFYDTVSCFIGKINQVPPMYSALKVDGKKLCDLARKGVEVERKAREITVFNIEISDFDGESAILDVSCSKGTYIRTLCADIGEKLGCGAIMETLVRTKTGRFEIGEAVTLEEFEKNPEKYVIPAEEFFDYPKFYADEMQTAKIKNGVAIEADVTAGEMYRVYSDKKEFICLSTGISENGRKLLKLDTAMWN